MTTQKIRRYDLDWLRVLVFALLILYHVGMFFVPWGWHIKNETLSEWLRWPMLVINQWRLPILFVISGMGTYYALGFRSGWQFIKERNFRLMLPLLVGMLLIVPPQVYLERLHEGDFTGSYWTYLTTVAFTGIYPEGNFSWHHLWFLPYLFIYSVLFVPLFIQLRRRPDHWLLNSLRRVIRRPAGLYLFILPLYFIEALIEPFFPVTHALIGDWFTLVNFGVLFLYGFLLIALGESWWQAVDRIKRPALWIATISFVMMAWIWHQEDTTLVHFTEAMLKVLYFWSIILALFGYATRWLNRPSATLSYANRAVYPFYILHQTITIILAYPLITLEWPFIVEFLLLSVGTFGLSWLIYEFLIRRIKWLWPLFGLKKSRSHASSHDLKTEAIA